MGEPLPLSLEEGSRRAVFESIDSLVMIVVVVDEEEEEEEVRMAFEGAG